MPSILDLPSELLLKILDVLESADIDVLFGIPELQEWLKEVVCVITDDTNHTHHTSIPTVFSLDDISTSQSMAKHCSIRPESLKKQYHVAIFELHPYTLEFDALDQVIPLLNAVSNHVNVYPLECTKRELSETEPRRVKYVSHRRVYYPEELWGKRTRTINFSMTYFHFQAASISPAVHRLPIIKSLVMGGLAVLPDKHGVLIEMPELENLTIDHTPVDDFLGVLNPQNLHKLRNLMIRRGPETTIDCTLIPSLALTYLEIDLLLERFTGLSCPNLEILQLTSTWLACVCDLTVPKLKQLDLDVMGNIALYNIQADSMSTLTLATDSRITKLHNIHAPMLTSALIDLFNDPMIPAEDEEKLDFSFLYPVEELNVHDDHYFLGALWDKNGDGTQIVQVPNLRELTISHPIELYQLKFPQLIRSLAILQMMDAYVSSSFDLSDLLIRTPYLCSLGLSITPGTTVETFITGSTPFQMLRQLEIEITGADIGLKFSEWELPELEVFKATYVADEDATIASTVSLIAPNLTVFVMDEYEEYTVDVSHSTKLEEFTATRGLRKLILPKSCPQLTTLDLSYNEKLEPLSPITLENVTSAYFNGTPRSSLEGVVTPRIQI